MREDVKKILFLGSSEDQTLFLKRAQEVGLVHFIDPVSAQKKALPPEVEQISHAIRILRGLPPTEQEENFHHLNGEKIVHAILDLNRKSEEASENIRVLNLEIARIAVFGNFSLSDIAYIEKETQRNIQFFASREGLYHESDLPDEMIHITNNHGLDYFMAINERPVAYSKMMEIKIERSLSDFKHSLKKSHEEHSELDHELKKFAKYNRFLHYCLIEALNQYHLEDVQTYVQEAMEGALFAVEGWVPANKKEKLAELTDHMNVYAEEIEIEPTDIVPTYLENYGMERIGEDLVHIYDTPSATDKDPSPWVLFCFTLFFAFIMADAGYGLVYLGLALFLRYKYPDLKGLSKRILGLFTVLSIGCIIWGILTTSFFGMEINPNNPIRKLSLIDWLAEKKVSYSVTHKDESYQGWVTKYPDLATATNAKTFLNYNDPAAHEHRVIHSRITDNIMFEMALFIGCLHLIISMIRYGRRTIPNIGWAIFLLGAYLYFANYLKIPSIMNYVGGIDLAVGGTIGAQLMIAGIAFAWISAIFVYGWKGIFEVFTVIQVFADTLSYLRLYALGLAGAIVAHTVNEISSGLPFIIGAILVLVSHFINIVLSTMSGVIHGLRLNFLEWYHYSFEGGGKLFNPLKRLKME